MLRQLASALLLIWSSASMALEVFEIPDADPSNGLWRPDIQAAYPEVDWQTLDVLCLPPGQFKFILIQNLPQRNAERPLTITNCGGQTRIGGLGHYYLFVLGGGSHWRLTGEYSAASGTGHPDYPGHADGQYANSQDSYGILIDDETIEEGSPSGLSIGGGATDFAIDFIEIRRVGFAGMLIKSDNDGAATMRNVRIHDNYIHDIGSEGIYIGSTQSPPQHSIENLKFYNNRVLRTGTEIFQLGQIGGDTEICNNVFLAGAMDWKNPFQAFQNNAIQLGPRYGNISFCRNIVIGAGSSWLNYLGINIESDQHPPGAVVEISDNYFSDSRHFGGYLARMTQPDMTTRIVGNRFRRLVFQYDEVEPGSSNYNQFFRMGSGSVANTSEIEFIDNQFDGGQFFVNNWSDPNTSQGNITASGNQQTSIPAVEFEASGFTEQFDWLRLEIWTEFDYNGQPVTYQDGDIVSVAGSLYECRQSAGCGSGLDPEDPANQAFWLALPDPTDDVRLSADSPIQGVGLVDGTAEVFNDRFESEPEN